MLGITITDNANTFGTSINLKPYSRFCRADDSSQRGAAAGPSLDTLSAPEHHAIESTSMCKHGFHFIHEMHYSSIAYFQGVMTGKGVKREVGVWSWQEARLTLCISSRLSETKPNKSQIYLLA